MQETQYQPTLNWAVILVDSADPENHAYVQIGDGFETQSEAINYCDENQIRVDDALPTAVLVDVEIVDNLGAALALCGVEATS